MIHRYNTIFRNYNYSKNTYKIETREASLVSSYCMIIKTRFHGENINIVCTRSTKGGDYRFSERPKRPLRGSGGSSGDDPPAKFFEWGY